MNIIIMRRMALFVFWQMVFCGFIIINLTCGHVDEYYQLLYKFKANSWSEFGGAIYLTRDVNGDGYGDILIGAYGEDVGLFKSAGAAYIFSGFDGSLLFTLYGENNYAFLGRALSNVDDTDGDGLPEILIGADGTDNQRGKVYHCSGIDGLVIREYYGETFTDSFGNDLEGINDIDNDGYGDFIVGAKSFENNTVLHRGAVYIFSGNPGLLPQKLLYKYEGTYPNEQMGYHVCRTSDVTKDGLGDFAYLTPYNQTGNPPDLGRVTVRSGSNGDLLIDIFGGPEIDAHIGSIEYGGDVNDDGWHDLLVGQSGFKKGLGRVIIYSSKDWSILHTFEGMQEESGFGFTISTAGDINDDGCSDILIGAYVEDQPKIPGAGSAYIYSGMDYSLLASFHGDTQNEYLGIALHGGVDVNADGLPDIAIGTSEDDFTIPASGSALVYAAKSLKANDEAPIGGTLELQLCVPTLPFGPYYLGFSLGSDTGIMIGSRTFPLNWDSLFTITFGNPILTGTLDVLGYKQISLPIANDPSLSGLTFYAAFLTLEKGKPKGVRTISNPEEIVLK